LKPRVAGKAIRHGVVGGDEVTGRVITNLHCWMRGVYPDWAPRRGHVALIALCGQRESQFEQKPRSAG
jgi:hypothetical protein